MIGLNALALLALLAATLALRAVAGPSRARTSTGRTAAARAGWVLLALATLAGLAGLAVVAALGWVFLDPANAPAGAAAPPTGVAMRAVAAVGLAAVLVGVALEDSAFGAWVHEANVVVALVNAALLVWIAQRLWRGPRWRGTRFDRFSGDPK